MTPGTVVARDVALGNGRTLRVGLALDPDGRPTALLLATGDGEGRRQREDPAEGLVLPPGALSGLVDALVGLRGEANEQTASQRAMIATELLEYEEAAAKERQGARTDLGDEPSGNDSGKFGESRDKAGEALGVSGRLVSDHSPRNTGPVPSGAGLSSIRGPPGSPARSEEPASASP